MGKNNIAKYSILKKNLIIFILLLNYDYLQADETIGLEGKAWPPFIINQVYTPWCDEAIHLFGGTMCKSSAHDLDNNGQWDIAEPLLLNHRALAGAFQIGTSNLWTIDTIRQCFRVPYTGSYRGRLTFTLNQKAIAVGATFYGESRSDFDIVLRAGLYDDGTLIGGLGTESLYTSPPWDFWEQSMHATIDLFLALYPQGIWIEAGTVVLDYAEDVLSSGEVDDARINNRLYNFDFLVDLESGVDYEWLIQIDSTCFAQSFTLLGNQISLINTVVQVDNVQISPNYPELVVTETSNTQNDNQIEFGNIPAGVQSTETFTVTNNGGTNLLIGSWVSSNGAFTLLPNNPYGVGGDVTLAPGESMDVDITFSPQSEINYSGQIGISSNDPINPNYYLQISGTGVASRTAINVTATPPTTNINTPVTISVTVYDDFGSLVGAGSQVDFVTTDSGQWSNYDSLSTFGVYGLTNSQGVASVTWTPNDIGIDAITATSEFGESGNTSVNVAVETLNFTTELNKISGDESSSFYLFRATITDQNSQPIAFENVSFQTTKGTLQNTDTSTNAAGECETNITTTESGPVIITVTIFGQAHSTSGVFQVGAIPSFPAGRILPVGITINSLDLSSDGTKLALGGNTSVASVNINTEVIQSGNFGEINNGILAVASNDNGNMIGLGISFRQRGIVTVGGSLTGTFPITNSSEGIGDGSAAAWLGSKLILGHQITSTKPNQFSLYDTNASLLSKTYFTTDDVEDIRRIVVHPVSSSQFAAISEGPDSSNHNYIYYGSLSGNTISSINYFLTPFENRGLAWSADGSQLAVGSGPNTAQIAVYNTSALGSGTPSATIVSILGDAEHIAFSDDGTYMAYAGDGSDDIYIHNASNWSAIYHIISNQGCKGLEWIPGTHTLITGGGQQIQYINLDDTQLPNVSITSPSNGHQTQDSTINIIGQITDSNGIDSARLRNNAGVWEDLTLDGSGNFNHVVSLVLGENIIEVEGTDNTGWSSGDAVSVNRFNDNTAPVLINLSISQSAFRPSEIVVLTATITDDNSGVDESSVAVEIEIPDETVLNTLNLNLVSGNDYSTNWDTTGQVSGTYYVDLSACDSEGIPNCLSENNAGSFIVNEAPSCNITAPTSDVVIGAGNTFLLEWNSSDADSNSLSSLYLDVDGNPASGLIPVPGGLGLNEAVTNLELNANDFSDGEYYVVVETSDEYGTVHTIATGKITIFLHDLCTNALSIEQGIPYNGSSVGATGSNNSSCGINDPNDVWHSFSPQESCHYNISLCGSGFDTTLSIFDGCGGAELACNNNYCNFQSLVTIGLKSGHTYLIRISGENDATGDYTLNISKVAKGDLDLDNDSDILDLNLFVPNWLDPNCSYPDWCNRADQDLSGNVNAKDFSNISNNWLNEDPNISDPNFSYIITTYATLPLGVAAQLDFDSSGYLYAGIDGYGSTISIYRVSPGGASVAPYGPVAFSGPYSVAVDDEGLFTGMPGAILVGDSGKVSIIDPNENSQTLTTFNGRAERLTLSSAGRPFFCNASSGESSIYEILGATLDEIYEDGCACGPYDIAINSSDQIFTTYSNGEIMLNNIDGAIITDPYASLGQNASMYIEVGPGGHWDTDLYMGTNTGFLYRINSTGQLTEIARDLGSIRDLTFGPDGAMYLSVDQDSKILKVTYESISEDTQLTGPMVLVDAGSFPYQNTANPQNWVYVDTFLIGKYEVANSQYVQFLNAADPDGNYWDSNQEIMQNGSPGNYSYVVQVGRESYPVRYVSFNDAQAYCAWLSGQTSQVYRLPTEHEWEKVAGWNPIEQHHYTYGYNQDIHGCEWLNYDSCYGLLPVGSFNGTDGKQDAKSYYGCYDMSGNLREHTSTIWSGTSNVIRGGYWLDNESDCRVITRGGGDPPTTRAKDVGFRIVLDLN